MAFDVSEEKVGTEIRGIPVYHLDELERDYQMIYKWQY